MIALETSLGLSPEGSDGMAISLYARATPGFDDRVAAATDRLRLAAELHGAGLIQASSLGAEDQVITDLIHRARLHIDVATLDTGLLHPQTLELLSRTQAHYKILIHVLHPDPAAVVGFHRAHGEQPMRESIELRKACCGVRKLEPLGRMLQGRTAWITGLRREQSQQRAGALPQECDDQGRTKLNVLTDWTWADVWHYIDHYHVPYNRLHDAFMPSIGCWPCTRAIAVGEDFRSGRWWWEDDSTKECGLHLSRPERVLDSGSSA